MAPAETPSAFLREQLDRAVWNQLCADLLDHVGSLLP